MVMHSGATPNHRSPPIDMAPHASMERQQQILLDLSIHKLQQEQVKYGIEPRLLRFVLINNALRSLQAHVLSQMAGGGNGVMLLGDHEPDSELFLNNTFKHGILSIPASPPTPVKVMNIDTDNSLSSPPAATTSSTPLTNGSLPHLGTIESQREHLETMPLAEESESDSKMVAGCKRTLAARLGIDLDEDECGIASKRLRPRSLSLPENLMNGTSSNDLLSDEPTPLSPIDFAKVDVSLYDFDARATLTFPPVAETPRSPPPSSLSCSLHAYTGDSTPIDPTSGGSSSSSSAGDSPTHLSLSPDSSEVDTLDDIDRIVNLLMA